MFRMWLGHLELEGVNTLSAGPAQARSFFDRLVLDKVSRRRYLQLLDKLYAHLVQERVIVHNPVSQEFYREEALPIELPVGLTDAQLSNLVQVLKTIPGWKGVRDRALAALTIGAGLRCSEVCGLSSRELHPNGFIELESRTVHKGHRTKILPDWCSTLDQVQANWSAWLGEWLDYKNDFNVHGDFVIPSTKGGKAYSPSGLFRRTSHWFILAKLTPDQGGVNILRNTFARLALQAGMSQVTLMEYLGHEHYRATYRHVLANS